MIVGGGGGSGKIEKKIFYQLCPCKKKFDQRMSSDQASAS